MKYEKTQIGWLMIIIFSVVIISLTLSYLQKFGETPLPLNIFLVLLIIFFSVLLVFYKLKIKVDQDGVHVIYGLGLVHIKIKPEKVFAIRVVKSPWYYGLGIRFTPKGMLYNIQGSKAVQVTYAEGKNKTVLIGTNDPENLKKALETKYGLSG
jgi:amino acid permease